MKTWNLQLLGLPWITKFMSSFLTVHVQLPAVRVHRCILGCWSTQNAIVDTAHVSPYVLRYLQPELTWFHSNPMSWENHVPCAKTDKTFIFWYTPGPSTAPKKKQPHDNSRWAIGASYNGQNPVQQVILIFPGFCPTLSLKSWWLPIRNAVNLTESRLVTTSIRLAHGSTQPTPWRCCIWTAEISCAVFVD